MLKKHYEKLLALMLTLILAVGCTGINAVQVSAYSITIVDNIKYTITSSTNLTVQYEGTTKKSATSASIPNTEQIGSRTYKVTSVAKNALKNNTKIKKLTIGKNVKKIGNNAFSGCKNLKNITINTTALTKTNVGANAFKGLNSKAVVTVPLDKLDDYTTLLKSKGLTGKNQKVKGKKGEDTNTSSVPSNTVSTFNPSEAQFDPEQCKFEIVSDGKQSSNYSVGDTITLSSRVRLNPPIYGNWEKDNRKLSEGFVRCGACGECFSNLMLAVHNSLELFPGGCWSNYYIGNAGSNNPTTWAFVPDNEPCKIVFQYTLPQGLSYKEGSVKVTDAAYGYDFTKSCEVSVSGNQVTITTNDIKSEPFYIQYDYESYKKNLYYTGDEITGDKRKRFIYALPIMVEIGAEVSSDINKESVISATTSYSYKGVQHTENYEASIHTAALCISNTDADGNSLLGAEFDLYQMITTYKDGSNLGTSDWSLLASGLHAGDVVAGLGTGKDRFGNEYRIMQKKAPEGYQDAYPFELELFISEDGTVSANDEDGNALEVKDGVVQVNVVNAKKKINSGNTANSTNTDAVQNTSQTTDTSNSTAPTTNTSTSTARKSVKVKATYYKNGKKESSMTYQQTVNASETMMDKKEIRDRAYVFKGCRLERITLNGKEIDSLPEKVEDGSEVCFYYVTE